jgi:hypothetical protein
MAEDAAHRDVNDGAIGAGQGEALDDLGGRTASRAGRDIHAPRLLTGRYPDVNQATAEPSDLAGDAAVHADDRPGRSAGFVPSPGIRREN